MHREAAVEGSPNRPCEGMEVSETWRPLAPESSQVVGIGDEMTSQGPYRTIRHVNERCG